MHLTSNGLGFALSFIGEWMEGFHISSADYNLQFLINMKSLSCVVEYLVSRKQVKIHLKSQPILIYIKSNISRLSYRTMKDGKITISLSNYNSEKNWLWKLIQAISHYFFIKTNMLFLSGCFCFPFIVSYKTLNMQKFHFPTMLNAD